MYADFRRILSERKKDIITVLIGFAVLLACFCAGYLFGIRNAGKTDDGRVSDNGNAAERVREELGTAGSSIGSAGSRIENAAAAAGRIEKRIDDAQERVSYLKGTAEESRRLVTECQSVLREVRAGRKTDATKN